MSARERERNAFICSGEASEQHTHPLQGSLWSARLSFSEDVKCSTGRLSSSAQARAQSWEAKQLPLQPTGQVHLARGQGHSYLQGAVIRNLSWSPSDLLFASTILDQIKLASSTP